jgi:hypothetical protein
LGVYARAQVLNKELEHYMQVVQSGVSMASEVRKSAPPPTSLIPPFSCYSVTPSDHFRTDRWLHHFFYSRADHLRLLQDQQALLLGEMSILETELQRRVRSCGADLAAHWS